MTYCYLLHFDRPHPRGRHPQHYVGFTVNLPRRIKQHASGTSRACLPRAMYEEGIPFTVARVWNDGTLALERRLHNYKGLKLLCPICAERRGRSPRIGRERHPAAPANVLTRYRGCSVSTARHRPTITHRGETMPTTTHNRYAQLAAGLQAINDDRKHPAHLARGRAWMHLVDTHPDHATNPASLAALVAGMIDLDAHYPVRPI